MEKKNIQGMVYEVILLGESHNTVRKKNNENYNPQSSNANVCSICITDWPVHSVVSLPDQFIKRRVLPGTVAKQQQHTMFEAPMLQSPPTVRLLCLEAEHIYVAHND